MKRTLVIGATPKPERYAYLATEMLKQYGHEVVAYGRHQGDINGTPIIPDFPKGQSFDTVTLYLNPANQEVVQQDILDLAPQRVIFNPGTENPPFEQALRNAGIQPLEACTLVLLRTGQF